MIHHGQCSFRALIGTALRLFYPEFMARLRRFTAHVNEGRPSCDVWYAMHDAVVLFIMHDVETLAVLKRNTTVHFSKYLRPRPKNVSKLDN